jgi:hypothetical protein
MPCCANCGSRSNLRLYDLGGADLGERRWWCLECAFSARRLGRSVELAPVWIEQAALHRLPMKLVYDDELSQSERSVEPQAS